MPKFMINIHYGDLAKRNEPKANHDFIMAKYGEWSQKIAHKTIAAHKLRDGAGRRLNLVDGVVKDCPFAETKEGLGGFYLVEAASYDEAATIARDCPTLLYQGGYVEVREVEI